MATQPIIPQQTGNPILDNPQLKAAFMAHMASQSAPPASPSMPAGGATPQVAPPIMGTQAPKLAALHKPAEQEPSGPVSMPPSSAPSMPAAASPSIKAPRGTVEGDEAHRADLLQNGSGISRIAHNIEGTQFGQNHPVLGKIAGVGLQGLATLGDIGLNLTGPGRIAEGMIPGTAGFHAAQVAKTGGQLEQDEENRGREAQTAATQAEIPLRQAETAQHQQQTAATTPVEITPEQAQALGSPELAGEKVSPSILAALSKQHGINTTKESTVSDTNQTRKETNANTVQGRENVANTQTESREKIAGETNAVRQTLGAMRAAATGSKTAAKEDQPTMATRNMSEMAKTVIPRMHAVSSEVDHLASALGPAVGRWNELMVNKGGTDYPEFAALDTDLDLLASAIVRTHFGARGGQQYRQELRKQFGEAQSPEDLKARIGAAEQWIQGYADAGSSKPAPQGNQPPAGAQIIKWEDVK